MIWLRGLGRSGNCSKAKKWEAAETDGTAMLQWS